MWLDVSWLLTALLFLLTVTVIRFIQHKNRYPPGPFPLPVIGNLHLFFSKTRYELLKQLQSRYGDVVTLWIGNHPVVHVSGWKYIKEVLVTRKDTFSGRPQSQIADAVLDGKKSISFEDPCPTRELVRKIAFTAIRNYVSSPRLEESVLRVIDSEIASFLEKQTPVAPRHELELIMTIIVASTAMGRKYDRDDQEVRELKNYLDKHTSLMTKCIPGEFLPFLKPFLSGPEKELRRSAKEYIGRFATMYEEHKQAFDGTVCDFTDFVLAAKIAASPENELMKQLTDVDFYMIILELFSAGIVTTSSTLSWSLLLLAVNPKVQDKAAQEIANAIKGHVPTADDKDQCPYIVAIFKEALRMRPTTPFGLSQKALYDTTLGGHKIPAGTSIAVSFDSAQSDPTYWQDPHQFRPERFLDNPDICNSHYMPFSLGRRSCIGEKMAVNQMFLILARLLQMTSFSLVGQGDLEPTEDAFFSKPKPYLLKFKPRIL